MGHDGGVTGYGSGNPHQDMLDFVYLLNTEEPNQRMSIENDLYY